MCCSSVIIHFLLAIRFPSEFLHFRYSFQLRLSLLVFFFPILFLLHFIIILLLFLFLIFLSFIPLIFLILFLLLLLLLLLIMLYLTPANSPSNHKPISAFCSTPFSFSS